MKKLVSTLVALAVTVPVAAGELEFTGSIGAESRIFFQSALYPEQLKTFQGSLEIEPDLRWRSENQVWDVVITPYLRLDAKDDERTHFDMREAYVRWTGDSWTVRAGLGKVFWGVAESVHLVDIINQSDMVEDLDGEDKLGQPMLEIITQQDWGQLTGYVLPAFRKRTFSGIDGRLRTPIVVENDLARFDEGADDKEDIDFALRYSHYFGNWDVGLSLFHGASREPRLVPTVDFRAIIPFYDDITQIGADIQYTQEAWLWKFEGFVRDTPFETFTAAVGGVEYTFYGVTDAGADLGVLVELQYDGRSEDPLIAPGVVSDNDIMAGVRLSMNDAEDTSLLAGIVTDLEDASMSGVLEATRRFGNSWVGEIEGRFFMNVDPDNLAYGFRRDSHVMFRLTKYF